MHGGRLEEENFRINHPRLYQEETRQDAGVSATFAERGEINPPCMWKQPLGNMTFHPRCLSRRISGLDLVRLFGQRSESSICDPLRQAAATILSATHGSRYGVAPRGGHRQRPRGGLARMGFCGGVVGECSVLSALCLCPRDCGDRRAARFKQGGELPSKQAQFPRATALNWDRHIRCHWRAAPFAKSSAQLRAYKA